MHHQITKDAFMNEIKTNDYRWQPKEYSQKLSEYRIAIKNGATGRDAAEKIGIPRATLRMWDSPIKTSFDETTSHFLQSDVGYSFLHKILIPAMLTFVIPGHCGIRKFCHWLDISGLSDFISSSYGTWQKVSKNIAKIVLKFGKKTQDELSKKMLYKEISIAIDETFFPKICLVGIELISGFILIEKFSEKRDAASWELAALSSIQGMNIKVIQVVGDQAAGIISYAKKNLAHYSSDLFHMQREISKGGSLALSSQVNSAEDILENEKNYLEKLIQLKNEQIKNNSLSPSDIYKIDEKITAIENIIKNSNIFYDENKIRQEKFKESLMNISNIYHPIDLETGKRRGVSLVEADVRANIEIIRAIFLEANLGESSHKYLEKAERVIPYFLSSIKFFSEMSNSIIKSFNMSKREEYYFQSYLLPAAYLKRMAKKERAKEKKLMLEKARELDAIGIKIFTKNVNEILFAAKNTADIFQRSSSAVEGRNGHLSLKHHSLHKISEEKLAVLTILQNYFSISDDGSTAAERFFSQKHQSLAEYVVKNIPPVPRAYAKKDIQN